MQTAFTIRRKYTAPLTARVLPPWRPSGAPPPRSRMRVSTSARRTSGCCRASILRAARARPLRSTSAGARLRACARACAHSRHSSRARRSPSATRWRWAASTRSFSSSATRSSGSMPRSRLRSRRSAAPMPSCRAAFPRSLRRRRPTTWTISPAAAMTSSCSRATCRPRRAAPMTRRRATRPISRRGRRICCTCPCVWRCAS